LYEVIGLWPFTDISRWDGKYWRNAVDEIIDRTKIYKWRGLKNKKYNQAV
jgi:hypothetical protein